MVDFSVSFNVWANLFFSIWSTMTRGDFQCSSIVGIGDIFGAKPYSSVWGTSTRGVFKCGCSCHQWSVPHKINIGRYDCGIMFHIWIQKSYDEIISFEKHSIIDEPCLFHWVGLHQSKYVKPTSRSYRWASIQSFSKLVNAKFFEQIFEQALDYSWRTTSQIINVSTLKFWINHIEIISLGKHSIIHDAPHRRSSTEILSLGKHSIIHDAPHRRSSTEIISLASIQSFMMHHIADHQLRSYY